MTAALLGMVLAAILPMPVSRADSDLDFTLVNQTGYGIKELFVSPSASDKWDDNILSEPLENNEAVEIKFNPDAEAAKWDIMITWVDGEDKVYWRAVKLDEIHKLTLKYDRASGKTTAISE